MGLSSLVDASRRAARSVPSHAPSSQSVILDGETASLASGDSANPSLPLLETGSWQQCKHVVNRGERIFCRKFICLCKQDTCPPKFRI